MVFYLYIYFLIIFFYYLVEIVNNKEKKVNLYNLFNKFRRLVIFLWIENIGGKGWENNCDIFVKKMR